MQNPFFTQVKKMNGLPENNKDYERLEYWNDRYAQDEESFEWCKSYADFRHLILRHVKRSDRILVLGNKNPVFELYFYIHLYNSFVFHHRLREQCLERRYVLGWIHPDNQY